MDLQGLLPILGALVAVTNVVVQALKKATWDKLPTNLLALIVAELLTVPAGLAYCRSEGVALTWYIAAGLMVAGVLVAYAAMFGFDKLKEALDWKKS